MSQEMYWIAVSLVIITASARVTRLITVDMFPPIAALRDTFENSTNGTVWEPLTKCGYCFSFWATSSVVASAAFSGVLTWEPLWAWMEPGWWLLFGTLGASYLAAIMMAKDGDDSHAGVEGIDD